MNILPIRKKTMSEKQLRANRANALKSTGPRTEQGRAVSRWNALKHGIFSTEVLIQGSHVAEDKNEFARFGEAFRRQFQPAGPLEQTLVEQIITAQWRLRRVLAAESGEVALGMESSEREHAHLNEKERACRRAAAMVPAQAVVTRIQGYESRLQRQLFRALEQLERLQRARKEEAMAQPVNPTSIFEEQSHLRSSHRAGFIGDSTRPKTGSKNNGAIQSGAKQNPIVNKPPQKLSL
jgi:hypothetical protein